MRVLGLGELERELVTLAERVARLEAAAEPLAGADPRLALIRERHCATWCGSLVGRFTPRQFELLALVALRPGVIRTRAEILEAVWPVGAEVQDRVVDTVVKQVRARFRAADPSFAALAPVYGLGYVWRV